MSIKKKVSHEGVFTSELKSHQISMPRWLYDCLSARKIIKPNFADVFSCIKTFNNSAPLSPANENIFELCSNQSHRKRLGEDINLMDRNSKYCGQIFEVIEVSQTGAGVPYSYSGVAEFDQHKMPFISNEIMESGKKYRLTQFSFEGIHQYDMHLRFFDIEKVSDT